MKFVCIFAFLTEGVGLLRKYLLRFCVNGVLVISVLFCSIYSFSQIYVYPFLFFSFSLFQGLPAVVIDSEKTRFWRSNMDRPAHFLSTIEAIYYFCRQLHNFMADLVSKHRERIMAEDEQLLLQRQFPPYDGQFDNLLFFFKHTYQVIKKRYKL